MSFLYRSAFAIADDIRAGRASALDAVEFFLQRIEAHNGQLNAVVAMDPDAARARAREADAAAARIAATLRASWRVRRRLALLCGGARLP